MSERPGPGPLLARLAVRRQAKRGFALAALVGAAVFAFFVLVPGTHRSPWLYAMLLFVLVTTVGMLFTAIFVAAAAYRLVQEET